MHYAAHFGTVGVDLFFVISGFIMWTTTETSRRGPVRFWLARIVRIVPLYWIFTTLYVAAALITPESFYVVHLEAAHIVKSYLFVPATHPNLGLIAPVYTLGWTLNYEMFFYLLFGFCLFVPSPRLRFALLASAFLLLVAGGLLAQPQGAIARTYTDPIMLEFLAGVMLAILAPLLMRCGTIAGLLLIGGRGHLGGRGLRLWLRSGAHRLAWHSRRDCRRRCADDRAARRVRGRAASG